MQLELLELTDLIDSPELEFISHSDHMQVTPHTEGHLLL